MATNVAATPWRTRLARRGPSQRGRALAGLGLVLAALAGLTLWLFSSVWAVGQAVIDIDQSAGPERGVNLS